MDIGAKLEFARKAIGYTQKKVSELTGIGDSSISEFEHNEREPKFSQLSKLAEVYKRSIEFFLTDKPPIDPVLLWRDEPTDEAEKKKIETEFLQLCRQYRRLELCTGEIRKATFPQPDVTVPEEFNFPQAESFARKVHNELCLGDIPSASLKRILEERYYVKIFHLESTGSALSTVSGEFGIAVFLSSENASWRRNYDLAHELFHLLTWGTFGAQNKDSNEKGDKLANAFASKLLMPEEPLRQRIALRAEGQDKIHLDQLDDLSREFGVSLDALVYRIATLFRMKKEDTEKCLTVAKQLAKTHKPREPDKPEKLPERYCDLAQRALREGKMSLMQFAKYMGISYKKAQEYLSEDEGFTDEKISISVA